jgi:predicted RNase H-like nuclease (RuvC/YqgF family)
MGSIAAHVHFHWHKDERDPEVTRFRRIQEHTMRSHTKVLISALVAGASLAAAVPAAAQGYSQQRYDDRYDRGDRYDRDDRYDHNQYRGNANAIARQIQQLQYRVERTDSRDRISEREAAALRNGLSQRETRILQDRIAQVRSRLQYERRDNDGRRW